MAAAQGVDQKQDVIFQTIQRATWFSPNTFRSYIAALIMTPYLPDEEKKKLTVLTIREGDQRRVVNIETIRSELQQFVDKLSKFEGGEAIRQAFGLGTINVFSAVDLVHLRDAIDEIAAYIPAPPESNIPAHMREMVDEFERQKEAKVALGKKREDAIAEMDKLMWHRLELIRQVNATKINAKTALSELFTSSQYLNNLAGLERDLGGRGYLEQFVQTELDKLFNQIVDVEKNPLEYRKLVELLSKDPTGSQAVSYLRHRIEAIIDSSDFFRTAYFTAHPQKKKEALAAIEEEAKGALQEAQPHAQAIEQEWDALRAEGVDLDELHALSGTRRPITEIRRWTQTTIKITTNEKFIEKLLIREAGKLGIRLNPHDTHLWVGRLRQLTSPGARLNFLKGRLEGLKPSQLNALFQTISPQLNALASFTPETIREAAQWRPDLLPQSVVHALTAPTSSLSLPEHRAAIGEISEKTGVSVDHVEAYAAGLNRKTLDTHVAQAKLGAPEQSWFKDFREKSLPKLEEWFGPKGKIPEAPAPPGAPPQPVVSQEIAGNFRALSGANAFRTRLWQGLRFLGVDRAVNFVARSAPVQAVTNTVTAPFRAAGNAVTGVKNWAKSQLIAGATSVGTKLVTWGAAQAAKAGIMGFAGQAAGAAGKGLLALTGGAITKIPFIGQAIGAVQAIGGATLGFLGSTVDFIRGKKSLGEWGASAFKSAGTLIGAAVGGLLGGAIGLLGLGVGAIPGALIGVVIGAMVGGMITGGLAAFAKKPEEVLKSLLGLLLIGGFALAALAQWAAAHVGALIGGTIGATIGTYIGMGLGGAAGFALCGPLCALVGSWIGGVVFGVVGGLIGTAVGWTLDTFLHPALTAGGQLLTIGTIKGLQLLNAAAGAAGQLFTLGTAFAGNILSAAGTAFGQLLTLGQIGLRGLLGWVGQAGMTLGGSILGGIGGFFMGGAPGALLGGGLGAVGGSWLAGGGLNSLLSGIGPALTNGIVSATNFLGSLTAPLTASSIVSTTTAVTLGGVAAAGGITMLFVIPSILSALYVPPDEGTPGQQLPGVSTTVDCFQFVAEGQPYPISLPPIPDISDPWTPGDVSHLTGAISQIRSSYPRFMDKICSRGVRLWRDSHHGVPYGGWTMTATDIRIYDNGVSDNLYTLSHELGHIYEKNFGNAGFRTQSFVTWIPSTLTCQGNIYPENIQSEEKCYFENFAEGISWVISGAHGTLPPQWLQWSTFVIQLLSSP